MYSNRNISLIYNRKIYSILSKYVTNIYQNYYKLFCFLFEEYDEETNSTPALNALAYIFLLVDILNNYMNSLNFYSVLLTKSIGKKINGLKVNYPSLF